MKDWTLLILILIFLSVISPLLILLLIGHHKKNKIRSLKKSGRKVNVTVIGFKQEPLYRYSAGSSGLYNTVMLRVVAEETIEGKRFEFKSERINRHNCNIKKGDTVTILVRDENPEQYYFDPYQTDI